MGANSNTTQYQPSYRTIRNHNAYRSSESWMKTNLGALDSCFPGLQGFSDLDAVIEKRGKLLILEFKEGNAPVPRGQSIMFNQLLRNNKHITGLFRVIVVWTDSETNSVTFVQDWGTSERVVADMKYLQAMLVSWYGDVTGDEGYADKMAKELLLDVMLRQKEVSNE